MPPRVVHFRIEFARDHLAKRNTRLPNWMETADQLGDDRLALPDHVLLAVRAQSSPFHGRRHHRSTTCSAARPTVSPTIVTATRVATLPSVTTALAPAVPAATVPQRRLRQLQVLQGLLDERLISPAEEQRVRRRIPQLDLKQGQ